MNFLSSFRNNLCWSSSCSIVNLPKRFANSDWLQYNNRPDVPPETTTIFLFPGQGSHFVGMGKQLIQLPLVEKMFQTANEMLRTNLLKICLEGPSTKLNETIHCQPAVFLISLAAALHLRECETKLVENCTATAGFSLGEITSLVFAGAMTFEQGLHLVRVRAEAMQKACKQTRGAMTSVFINHDTQLSLALQAALNHCTNELHMEHAECRIANYLYSDCKVIAGNIEAIEFVESHAAHFNIPRVKRLPVSGAFHTSLMKSAMRPVSNVLTRMETLQVPTIPVISALDVNPYNTVDSVRRKLCMQMTRPVRWEQTLHALYSRPQDATYPRTVELGPGKQLGTMLRMVNRKAYVNYQSVDV